MAEEYQVLRINEMTRVGDTNNIEHYYRHTIKTKKGVVLTVDILAKDFTAAKAAPILDARAKEADKIMAL